MAMLSWEERGAVSQIACVKTHNFKLIRVYLIAGNYPMMNYFDCMDRWVYINLGLSLIVFGLISALRSRSIKEFFASILMFCTIIFIDYKRITNNSSVIRILVAIWLLALILVLSIFSGELYGYIVRGQPLDVIDSFDDLYRKAYWKDSKIYMAAFVGIFDFILFEEMEGNQKAKNIYDRSETLDSVELIHNHSLSDEVFTKIMTENKVLSINKMTANYLINQFFGKHSQMIDDREGYGELFVTDMDDSVNAYYINVVDSTFSQAHLQSLNRM